MPRHNQPTASAPRRKGSSRQSGARNAGPRPHAGQHFLTDPSVAERIVDAADLHDDDDVLEVGPGRGAITGLLLQRAAHVTAIELDEYLAQDLRRRFGGEPRLTVIASSILDHAPDVFLAEGGRTVPYTVVANLPYYITAPVMRHFLERGPRPSRMVVMVQREVADSITARGAGLSLLGVSVQVFGAVETLFRVSPQAFDPPPRVDSTVVRITCYTQPVVPEAELTCFFAVVRAGFRNPRKQLHNALAGGLWLPPGEATSLLGAAGIDPMRRPGTLTVEEWLCLSRAYELARPSFGNSEPHADNDGTSDWNEPEAP